MGIWSALSGSGHSKPASQVTAQNMTRAAKAARRGGSAITTRSGRHGDHAQAKSARVASTPAIQAANRAARNR